MAPPPKSFLTVGVLLLSDEGVQYLDVAPVDILAMLQPSYLAMFKPKPSSLEEQGVSMEICWITETGDGPANMTAGAKLSVTHSIANAPALDILIIPGPTPTYVAPDAVKAFIQTTQRHATAVMSICTGILPLVQSGVLAHRAATAPILLVPLFRKTFADVRWSDERRWVRDGNVWTSGAITNGMDMMCVWMREYFWDRRELLDQLFTVAAVGGREECYAKGDRRWALEMAWGEEEE